MRQSLMDLLNRVSVLAQTCCRRVRSLSRPLTFLALRVAGISAGASCCTRTTTGRRRTASPLGSLCDVRKDKTRWLVDLVVLLVLLSFLVLGWHHYPIILQPYDYMMSEENVDTYVSCSLIVCIYFKRHSRRGLGLGLVRALPLVVRFVLCPAPCGLNQRSTTKHQPF